MSEIVLSHDVRKKIGWDYRHERIAREVMREYGLILPRDREIIRQVTMGRIHMPIKPKTEDKESDDD